jgi:hypothetical protein
VGELRILANRADLCPHTVHKWQSRAELYDIPHSALPQYKVHSIKFTRETPSNRNSRGLWTIIRDMGIFSGGQENVPVRSRSGSQNTNLIYQLTTKHWTPN